MPLIPRTRDQNRTRALIVRPRGTQRILRPERARPVETRQFEGGSRSVLPVGFAAGGGGLGPGGRGGGAGAQAAIARALAGTAFPQAQGPDVFASEPVSPFAPPVLPPGGFPPGTIPPLGSPPETFAPIGGDPVTFAPSGGLDGAPTINDLLSQPTPERLALLRLLSLGRGF